MNHKTFKNIINSIEYPKGNDGNLRLTNYIGNNKYYFRNSWYNKEALFFYYRKNVTDTDGEVLNYESNINEL